MLIEGTVILQGVVGSTAYGLAREGSDVDQLGIYVAPFAKVLGLDHKVVENTYVQKAPDPDLTVHEVGKYASLALQCNPTVLELMFLPDYMIATESGKALIAIRDAFLSTKAVLGRYGGYATAQATRLLQRHESREEGFSSDVRTRTEKHGRHCARLLFQGADLLSTGRITVNVGPRRDEIFEYGRLALSDPQAFYDAFVKLRAKMDDTESVLPDHPERDKINKTLADLRTRYDNLGPVTWL